MGEAATSTDLDFLPAAPPEQPKQEQAQPEKPIMLSAEELEQLVNVEVRRVERIA